MLRSATAGGAGHGSTTTAGGRCSACFAHPLALDVVPGPDRTVGTPRPQPRRDAGAARGARPPPDAGRRSDPHARTGGRPPARHLGRRPHGPGTDRLRPTRREAHPDPEARRPDRAGPGEARPDEGRPAEDAAHRCPVVDPPQGGRAEHRAAPRRRLPRPARRAGRRSRGRSPRRHRARPDRAELAARVRRRVPPPRAGGRRADHRAPAGPRGPGGRARAGRRRPAGGRAGPPRVSTGRPRTSAIPCSASPCTTVPPPRPPSTGSRSRSAPTQALEGVVVRAERAGTTLAAAAGRVAAAQTAVDAVTREAAAVLTDRPRDGRRPRHRRHEHARRAGRHSVTRSPAGAQRRGDGALAGLSRSAGRRGDRAAVGRRPHRPRRPAPGPVPRPGRRRCARARDRLGGHRQHPRHGAAGRDRRGGQRRAVPAGQALRARHLRPRDLRLRGLHRRCLAPRGLRRPRDPAGPVGHRHPGAADGPADR